MSPTLDAVLAETNAWLSKDNISIDWVNQVDTVLSDVVTSVTAHPKVKFFGSILRSLIPTSVEYTVTLDQVGNNSRVQLRAGSRTVGEALVRPEWWTALEIEDTVAVRTRACAAATVTLLTRLLHTPPTTMHGLDDPEVLFLLNEATHQPNHRQKIVNKASALEPANRLVRFAVLQQELRFTGGNKRTKAAYQILRPAFDRLADDCDEDPALYARAKYSAAVCSAHEDPVQLLDAHERLLKLLEFVRQKSTPIPAAFRERFEPVVYTALACTCQTFGEEEGLLALVKAQAYGSDPRAMYNLACGYAQRYSRFKSEGSWETAKAYLEAAGRADRNLKRFGKTDPTLEPLLTPPVAGKGPRPHRLPSV